MRVFAIVLFGVWLALAGAPVAEARAADVVRQIVIEGAQRIEPETVRSYLLIQEGDPFDDARIDRSLKSLYATGLFADVSLRRSGEQLVIWVAENPIINRIAFEGNRYIPDETLTSEVALRPRVIYTRTKVQNDVSRILTLYRRKGRFAATVEPKIIQLEQNRVDLVFEITEGDPTEIRSIRFIGNREFDDEDLRKVVRTKESRWWRFFTLDDNYDPDRLTLDRELLRRYYLSEGFADFRVLSAAAELTPDRRDFFITFTVEEGPRYTFGVVDVEPHLKGLEKDSVADVVELEQGDWYDADGVEASIEKLTEQVNNLGFAFVDVRPRINRDREKQTIDIAFEINEGPRVFVERIDIEGNVRTVDEVIRREFQLVEGDAFNASKLRRSRRGIQNLDFFEKIEVEQVPGSAPDKTVIKVDVEEKSTGSLSIGAGYSTTSGMIADFGVRERNFLGKGQDVRVNFAVAERKTSIDLGFTEPFFLGRRVAAGFDLFHTSTDNQDVSSYDTKVVGGSLRLGYNLMENLTQSLRYTLKEIDVANVPTTASLLVQAEAGAKLLSEVSQTLLYDKRDNAGMPTQGYFLRMGNDVGGLGGDVRYFRTRVDAGKYFPVADEWVLAVTGSAGYVMELGENVRIVDRFLLGGDSLRGFANAGVGPRDISTQDALGGEWMYLGSTELIFPLGLPSELGVKGRTFLDVGSLGKVGSSLSGVGVYDTGSLRASAGLGVTWHSPMGPLGVDFAYPLIKEKFDQEERIRINFGTSF